MDTREKIIVAALRQFEAHGFAAATTKAIAAEAGVAEVTLFRVFGDKKTLFMKTAAYIGEKFGLMNIPARLSGDFRLDMRAVCQSLLRHFVRSNALIRMLIFEVKKYGDSRNVLVEIRQKAMDNIRGLVCRNPQFSDGRCTPDCLEWLMSSLIGASLAYHQFHANDDPDAYIASQGNLIADAFVNQMIQAGEVKP